MAQFKFRLATLLRLREAARDDRRIALAEAYRVDEVLGERIERLGEEIDWLRQRCRQAAGPGAVDVDGLLEAQRYELALLAHRNQLRQQREAVAEEVERRRQALAEANREVRVLEQLREKQMLRHNYEDNRRQVRQLDELAHRRAAREEAS